MLRSPSSTSSGNAVRHVLLALESSCDDTAAAVLVSDVAPGAWTPADALPCIASTVVAAQTEHAAWGGVVPEVASRAHQQLVVGVARQALAEAGVAMGDLTAVAATRGPGLAGPLLVGMGFAKGVALATGAAFVGVHHLDGHLASALLSDAPPSYPYLALTVSGGHTLYVRVDAPGQAAVLGRTRDDAAGEAFDKVAKLMGLGYPGGPVIDRLSETGDPAFVRFPRTRLDGFDVSFSGIKTAVRVRLDAAGPAGSDARAAYLAAHGADLAASFQAAAVDMLVAPLARALDETGLGHVALVGGVSANRALRTAVANVCATRGAALAVPPMRYATDNAAMIGLAAWHRLATHGPDPLSLDAAPSASL